MQAAHQVEVALGVEAEEVLVELASKAAVVAFELPGHVVGADL